MTRTRRTRYQLGSFALCLGIVGVISSILIVNPIAIIVSALLIVIGVSTIIGEYIK